MATRNRNMTKQQAIRLGRKDGETDVRDVLKEQGIDVVRATLAPGQLGWDEGAINAGAAVIVGVPDELHADYYAAYRDAAAALARKLAATADTAAARRER